jgi:glutathione synthase/RimK-type ligase-like ATP-grasp enzyme
MDDLEGFVSDDELVFGPLEELGWVVKPVSWRCSTDWNDFAAVVIRTTWDYQADPKAFLAALEVIDGSRARLANDLELVRWNLRKTYLRELQSRGVTVAPSHWGAGLRASELMALFSRFETSELVIKPVVGANADDAFRLTPESLRSRGDELEALYWNRGYLAQPFLARILDEGELSVVFFSGRHSHAIRKIPRPGDFRVQEEHGGSIEGVTADPALLAAAERAMAALGPAPLQARVDLVRLADGRFAVMELELIEPALYFRTDPGSATRFAAAFDRWFRGSSADQGTI